jgi:hypothetical protein
MNSRTARTLAAGLALWSAMAIGAPAQRRGPTLISPDGRDEESQVATGCPTFSWTLVADATGYELRIYEAGPREEISSPTATPRLRKVFPDGATSWTPALKDCLPPGRYGWAVAALVGEGEPRWSPPGLFEVAATPPSAPQARERRDGRPLVLTGPPPASAQAGSSSNSNVRHTTDEAYVPPLCGTGKFADVPAGSAFCRWIEQLDRDGIMTSCDGGSSFCPDNPVTRKQLAMALGKTARGTATWHPAEGSNWLAPPVGNTLTTLDDIGDVGQYTSIAIGVDGLPIISYYDNTTEALKVAHCHDVACAGQKTITMVDNDGNLGGFSSIAIGSDGLPIISYHDATVDFENGFDRQALKVAHCNDVACAGQDETLTFVVDTNHPVGYFTSIAIGSDGLPIISHLDITDGALLVTHCNDTLCATPATTSTVDPSGVALGATSIAIGPDGFPLIAYVDSGALKLARCSVFNCAGAMMVNTLNSLNPLLGGTAITIGPDGLPLIAHRVAAGGLGWIALAHCDDWYCNGQDETLSGLLGNTEEFSLTVGADGLPILSFADSVLQILRCNDLACTGGGDAPRSIAAVGRYSSVTIGVDGLPIASYYDGITSALKVVHCANEFCTPYFRRR